jgi:hypothetical protein
VRPCDAAVSMVLGVEGEHLLEQGQRFEVGGVRRDE